ncbi:unnamed protein product [Prunus armeniaca]
MFEMGVKLDMNKVYDREEWDFLEAVMIRMGFTERWVELITVTDLLRRKDKGIDLRPQSIIVQTCKASGQQISLAKSIIFFSPNTPSNLGKRLCHILGISHVDDPERYLGLPTIWGRSKREALLYIKERIMSKIQGLSKQSGGMGFCDLHEFNLVLITKQCWRLITEPDSLWAKSLKGVYFPNEIFLQARKGSQASWCGLVYYRGWIFCCKALTSKFLMALKLGYELIIGL